MPLLPPKSFKTTDETLSELQRMLLRFIEATLRSEILKTSRALCNFLKLEKRDWLQESKKHLAAKFTRKTQDVISLEGKVNV